MAFQTIPKQFFIYDILALNTEKKRAFEKDVRLKMMIDGKVLYVDHIVVSLRKMKLIISGDCIEPQAIKMMDIAEDVTYEFDY